MSLELLLTVAFGGALLTYFLGKISSRIRDTFAVIISLFLVFMVACLYGKSAGKAVYFGFLGLPQGPSPGSELPDFFDFGLSASALRDEELRRMNELVNDFSSIRRRSSSVPKAEAAKPMVETGAAAP